MRKKKQRGITLIETIGALALGSLMLVGISAMMDTSVDEAKAQQAALQQEQVAAAAGRFISANFASLAAGTAGGTVATVTVAQLAAAGFLPAGFAVTNAFRQASCVLVRQPLSGRLDALVATFGGRPIPERDIAVTAMLSGTGGGYISAAAPATARGASWTLDTSDYRGVACGGAGAAVLTGAAADGGHLVASLFSDGPGQLSSDFLYRNAVPGRPELNQMNEPITMAGNALIAPGADCGSKAALGVEENSRSLLVCGKDGKWQQLSTWKEAVPEYQDLPATGNAAGDVRMVTSLSRAFTYSGSAWVPVAVDEKGNLSVPGSVEAQANVTAKGRVRGENGVEGSWVYGWWWVEGQSLYINQPVAAGQPCHIPFTQADGTPGIQWAIGTFKHDADGVLLGCTGPDKVFKYQNGTLYPNGAPPPAGTPTPTETQAP